jgi:Ser/Thr protein kinase RdoA (MazF antagonist)
MSSDGDRLPQGYTNRTRRVAGAEIVEKIYLGSDARIRLQREEQCLRRAAGVLPVPKVLDRDEARCVLRVAWIAGTPGQLLLTENSARDVLVAAGALLARLQTEATPLLAPVLEGVGTVAAHGDFGPQNLLFDADHQVLGLVDWEFAHLGDAVEDLAWAEWIVRMHHPAVAVALDGLFAGYGARPAWSLRRAAMLAQCERLRQRCESEKLLDAEAMWRTRLGATEGWTE